MGGSGSGRKKGTLGRKWSEEEKESKIKAPEERRQGKSLSFYINDLVKLRSSAQNLGVTESDYVRTLIHREESETITKIAIQLKNHYEIQERNIEKLEEDIEEIKREQANLLENLKKMGIRINNK
jgi:hypothetical protein